MTGEALPDAGPAARASEGARGWEYHRVHRATRRGGWWSLLAAVVAIGGFLAAQVIAVLGFLVFFAVSGEGPLKGLETLVDLDDFRPRSLLFQLLAIGLATPLVMVGAWLVAAQSPRWLMSVRGRVRWSWFWACVGVSLLTLVATVVLGGLLPIETADEMSGGLNDVTRRTIDFLLVLVIFTPFQAAAEEYVFRGLLTQAFGAMAAPALLARVLAVVVPALLFALAHGTQSGPIFLDRFAFGVVAGILTLATGGLEAGIAYHVVNNYLAFGIALFFGDLGDSLQPEGGNGWDVVLTLLRSAVFLVLVLGTARTMGVERRTEPGVLEAPNRRV